MKNQAFNLCKTIYIINDDFNYFFKNTYTENSSERLF